MDHEQILALAQKAKKLATTTWRDFDRYPGRLTAEEVLPYFCVPSNPFYDRTSNNEIMKMQGGNRQVLEQPGTRYVLHHSHANLHVIKKERVSIDPKTNNQIIEVLSCYYILGGIVYQAPTIHGIVASRIFNSLYSANKMFHHIQPYAHYSTITGQYYWQFENEKDYSQVEREIEEDLFINRSTRPPYSKAMQSHVDKMIENLEKQSIS
jgi:hypothetical protein